MGGCGVLAFSTLALLVFILRTIPFLDRAAGTGVFGGVCTGIDPAVIGSTSITEAPVLGGLEELPV
jgi:hypothetical protein